MSTPIDQDRWKATAAAVLAEIASWRGQHPVATFAEIEAAITQQLRPLREQVLTDTIHTSAQVGLGQGVDRAVCPICGARLQAKGRKRRTITTHQGEQIPLERTGGSCPRCGAGFFPPGS